MILFYRVSFLYRRSIQCYSNNSLNLGHNFHTGHGGTSRSNKRIFLLINKHIFMFLNIISNK